MSPMRNTLAAYQDVDTASDPEKWVSFLEAVANAHDAALQKQKTEIIQTVENMASQNKYQKGINIKDLKPDKY